MALDESYGASVEHDYGRADGKWHPELFTCRIIYGVEIAERPSAMLEKAVRRAAERHGFGVLGFANCTRCGEDTVLFPIYANSGGFAGKSIFYLTAPAAALKKASE